MLLAMLLMAQLSAAGMLQIGSRTILTYTTQQSVDVQWSTQPTTGDVAATSAARLSGGARASLQCSADKQGDVVGCEIVAAEPDRQEVKASALGLTTLYRLNDDATRKAKWSLTQPVIWLQIVFPDKQGVTPNDCNPAFGCIIEPPPPPPPLPSAH